MYALSNVRKIASALAIAGLLGTLVSGFVPTIASADGDAPAGNTVTFTTNAIQAPTPISDNPIVVTATISSSTMTLTPADIQIDNNMGAAVQSVTANSDGTYTVDITPPNVPHEDGGDSAHHTVTVEAAGSNFTGTNSLSFWWDPSALSSSDDRNVPVIMMAGGPTEGSTVNPADAVFNFSVDDPNATVQCSVVGQSDTDAFYPATGNCGSPQDFSPSHGNLGDGSYRFVVEATNKIGTASTSIDFTVSSTTSASSGSGSGSGSGSTDTNAPVIAMTSGSPTDGSTQTSGNVSFGFTVDDASSTVTCSNVDQSASDTLTSCTSPANYTLADGSYRFVVQASNNMGTTSSTINYTVNTASSGSGSSGGSQTTSPSTSTGGGATGNGNNGALGVPTGNTVIPNGSGSASSGTSGNAVIPTVPVSTQTTAPGTGASLTSGVSTAQTTSPAATTPVVSQSTGGSALVAGNAPATTGTSVTPGVPNTGSETVASTGGSASDQSLALGSSSSLAAAAATSGGGIPGWVWLILAGIVIIAIGVWALRQPA